MTPGPLTLDAALAGRVAVWGMGAEGLALVTLALERGVEPVLIDDLAADAAGRVAAALGGIRTVSAPGDVDWSTVDVVVRAPGVSRYRAELAAAESAGTAVTTTMALWLEDYAAAPVLAITGTKGKSTTAALAAAILEADGRQVELVGNIGVPVVDTYRRPRPDAYVVEVSSYQAADVTRSPRVVVLTSLAPDHLDWHGGVDAYYRDKLRLVEAGPPGRLAVNSGSDVALARTAGYSDRTLFGPDGRVRVTVGGWIEADGTDLIEAARLRVAGRHNAWNLCGAIAGIQLLTGAVPSTPAVESAVDGFAGLPSRCQVLGERDGRTYVDDALASNPFAAATSVGSFAGRPLTVIVGGADRGVDPGLLVDALSAHRPAASVVVLPPESVRLRSALVDAVGEIRSAADITEAVEIAEGLTAPGGVVLFSPGAPTPEGGGGYRSRSRSFATAAGFDAG